jgi:hypothetical protein
MLARYENGKYNFLHTSMRVEPGVKIMFTRQDGDNKSPIIQRRSFAVGQYNVPNIEKWIMAYDRISGAGNLGYGSLRLNSPPSPGFSSRIFVQAVLDPVWSTAIKEESAGCMAAATQLKKLNWAQSGAIDREANCIALNPFTFATVYTRAV